MRRIYSLAFTEVLSPMGFRRSGGKWTRGVRDGLSWLIQVERGSWNSADSIVFRPYFAVMVPRLSAIINGEEAPQSYSYGAVFGNFAEVGPRRFRFMYRRSPSYDLRARPEAEDAHLVEALREQLREDVLPFLGRFGSLDDVVQYLDSDTRRATSDPDGVLRVLYVAVLYAVTGETQRARARLADAQQQLGDDRSHLWSSRMRRVSDAIKDGG